jgi:hypothetical protein
MLYMPGHKSVCAGYSSIHRSPATYGPMHSIGLACERCAQQHMDERCTLNLEALCGGIVELLVLCYKDTTVINLLLLLHWQLTYTAKYLRTPASILECSKVREYKKEQLDSIE